MNRWLTISLCALLTGLCAFGADEARPHCDSKHAGAFWPEPSASEAGSLQGLAHSGDLQICSHTSTWRYKWMYVTVTIDTLRSKTKHGKSGLSKSSSYEAGTAADDTGL